MNRSLMVIFVMGVIAMVLLTVFGSFFVGKVGGAENVLVLQKDLKSVFGGQMADPEALDVKLEVEEKLTGLVVSYRADPELGKNPKAMEFQVKRIASFILGERQWRGRLAWVKLRVTAADGKVLEQRFDNRSYRPPEE